MMLQAHLWSGDACTSGAGGASPTGPDARPDCHLAPQTGRAGVQHIGATTIGRILHEEDYRVLRDRAWCDTGTMYRVRKDGVARVPDQRAQGKKPD
jgi:hypothetical protein